MLVSQGILAVLRDRTAHNLVAAKHGAKHLPAIVACIAKRNRLDDFTAGGTTEGDCVFGLIRDPSRASLGCAVSGANRKFAVDSWETAKSCAVQLKIRQTN